MSFSRQSNMIKKHLWDRNCGKSRNVNGKNLASWKWRIIQHPLCLRHRKSIQKVNVEIWEEEIKVCACQNCQCLKSQRWLVSHKLQFINRDPALTTIQAIPQSASICCAGTWIFQDIQVSGQINPNTDKKYSKVIMNVIDSNFKDGQPLPHPRGLMLHALALLFASTLTSY